ncbi:MAG: hypothetical protein WDN24_09715 [Sphingomonas sp.]
MARYYFNMHDGMAFPDNHGRELPGLQEARHAAIEYMCEMLRTPGGAWDGGDSLLQVTNVRGTALFSLAFCGTDAPATAA